MALSLEMTSTLMAVNKKPNIDYVPCCVDSIARNLSIRLENNKRFNISGTSLL